MITPIIEVITEGDAQVVEVLIPGPPGLGFLESGGGRMTVGSFSSAVSANGSIWIVTADPSGDPSGGGRITVGSSSVYEGGNGNLWIVTTAFPSTSESPVVVPTIGPTAPTVPDDGDMWIVTA